MKKIIRKRPILASVLLAGGSLVVVTAKKIFDYSAPPDGPKDCDFVFPVPETSHQPVDLISRALDPGPPLLQKGGTINDASCLNRTQVYGIVSVHTEEDIRQALQLARNHGLKVTPAGQRHSMGGQSFSPYGLVLDMREFRSLKLDRQHKVLTAQAGATWQQIQRFLDPQGLALQAMQSINIFTVGGTLSVNAHGISHRPGSVASTIKSLRIMMADGEVKTASPSENPELFRMAIGGYGLFGVLLDADIQLMDNEVYAFRTQYMDYTSVPGFYEQHIDHNNQMGLFYARLSVSPGSYLKQTAVHTYEKVEFDGPIPALDDPKADWLGRLVINFSKTGGFGRRVRWALETSADRRLHECISRNRALTERDPCLVSRNQEMYDPMLLLKNRLRDTDILQEYFVPPERMPEFIDGLREVVLRNRANLLNVTLRVVHRDDLTVMAYAPRDMFAFVLYFNQKLEPEDTRKLRQTTTDLIDLAIRLGGTFYLPYQLYYSRAQLEKAYPAADRFFEAKRKYDPRELFSNKFYEKYGCRK